MSRESFPTLSLDGSDLYFCLVGARYNAEQVDRLMERVAEVLRDHKVRDVNIAEVRVPGSNEIPYAAYLQAMTGQFDAIIALGVVLAGETSHHEVIATTTASSFHNIGMMTEVPIINGILTVASLEQAQARISGDYDRGSEFARAALEMARLKVACQAQLDELSDEFDEGEDDDLDGLFRKN